MSQRRSYPNSGDFNLDDLFRPEPAPGPAEAQQPAAPAAPAGAPEYPGHHAAGAPWGEQPAAYAAPPVAAAPETQYLPPYPTSEPAPGGQPSYGGQQTFGGQQQTFGDQQSFEPQQSYDPQTTQLRRTPARGGGGGGGGRPSRKAVIGGVVAACAVGGILVGVLASGGGDDSGKTKAAKGSEKTTVAQASGSGAPAALSAEGKTQAQGLSTLLSGANSSRQAVIGAVSSIQKCDKVPDAQTALTQAATQRRTLLTSLAALKVDKVPTGQQLVDQLNAAWQASASADDAYAAWAGDAVAACDPAKQQDNAHKQAGDTASGTASGAKKQASTLWNAIAAQAGLPTLSDSQL